MFCPGILSIRHRLDKLQYHIAQLARRIYGSKIAPRAEHLNGAVDAAKSEGCQQALEKLMKSDINQLKEIYKDREIEPEMAAEDWTPAKRDYL